MSAEDARRVLAEEMEQCAAALPGEVAEYIEAVKEATENGQRALMAAIRTAVLVKWLQNALGSYVDLAEAAHEERAPGMDTDPDDRNYDDCDIDPRDYDINGGPI